MASLCQLNTLIGREFAYAVNELLQEAKVLPQMIEAIGSHGQTLCHNTADSIPYTLQLGCAHTISSITNIKVVADFRTRDLVNGGQGAPFAPVYHQELFTQLNESIAVVNIGGIANITIISPDSDTRGWDVGPGNCLMDAWIFQNQGKTFDADGIWSRQGKVILPLYDTLLSDAFFQLPDPKSIGKEYFSMSWLEPHIPREYQTEDVQCTLSLITAHSIAQAILQDEKPIKQVYLCGGGTHNIFLCEQLADLLHGISVQSIAKIGVSPDFVEAMMFAWLAFQTINEKAVDLRAITGSKTPAILGAIYPVIKSY